MILGFAGGPTAIDGRINVGDDLAGDGMNPNRNLLSLTNAGFDSGFAITITSSAYNDAASSNFTLMLTLGKLTGEDLSLYS